MAGSGEDKIPSLKLIAKAPENGPGPKRKLVFQPSIFRCKLLVSGRVSDEFDWDVINGEWRIVENDMLLSKLVWVMATQYFLLSPRNLEKMNPI